MNTKAYIKLRQLGQRPRALKTAVGAALQGAVRKALGAPCPLCGQCYHHGYCYKYKLDTTKEMARLQIAGH